MEKFASIFLGSPRTVTKLLAEPLTKTLGRVRETEVSCGRSNGTEKMSSKNHVLYHDVLYHGGQSFSLSANTTQGLKAGI